MSERYDRDPELEARVLATIVFSAKYADALVPLLTTGSFWLRQHQTLFDIVELLHREQKQFDDFKVITDRLRAEGKLKEVGGAEYLIKLSTQTVNVPSTQLVSSAQRLNALARIRRLVELTRDLEAKCNVPIPDPSGLIDAFEQESAKVTNQNNVGDTFHTLKESSRSVWEQLKQSIEAKKNGTLSRPVTGLTELDNLIGGLQNGQFFVVAARPSMGKTALMLNIAANVAGGELTPRVGVHVISAETRHTKIAGRMLGTAAKVSVSRIWQPALLSDDFGKLLKAMNDVMYKLPITIDDKAAPTLAHVRASIRRAQAYHRKVDKDGKVTQRLGCVVLDYLQLMKHAGRSNGTREQEVGAIADGLLQAAKDFDVPLIALSQLSRAVENRDDKRPRMSDIRESGNIEQAADVVMAIYRDDYYDKKSNDSGLAEIIVLKSKDTATGTVKVRFQKEWMLFSDENPEPQWPKEDSVKGSDEKEPDKEYVYEDEPRPDN